MAVARRFLVFSGFGDNPALPLAKIAAACGLAPLDLDDDAANAIANSGNIACVLLSGTAQIAPSDMHRVFPEAGIILLGEAHADSQPSGYDRAIAAGQPLDSIVSGIRDFLTGTSPGTRLAYGERLVGESAAMEHIRRLVGRLSASRATALIHGDTGTGKEVVALLLHHNSPCADRQLVPINCAAIPEAMIEGELFGYEKGAFSGAIKSYPGKFRLADGGTLFLDEVGELSLSAQAKILRALEAGEIFPLGSMRPVRCNVRVVAATNRDLRREVEAGRFRADLFYRLAVVQLPIPPLNERTEDIGPIAQHLLQQICSEMEIPVPQMTRPFLLALENCNWPGNVREMRNAIEHAVATARDAFQLHVDDLPGHVVTRDGGTWAEADPEESEREFLMRTLAEAGGQKTRAARRLNCSRMTLYRRLERAGLSAQSLQFA